MVDFVHDSWRDILIANHLENFDALWALETPWFEPPNQRRGGWSGVARVELSLPSGEKRAMFLKRQENHKTFSWCHPFAGIPTFLREFELLRHYHAQEIPTLEPVFFGFRKTPAGHRAILATSELTGFTALEGYVLDWKKHGFPPRRQRQNVIKSVASLTRQIHTANIQHNCYYPKHIFIRLGGENLVEARVIDLEKSRWRPLSIFCTLRDLDTLNRHSPQWSHRDRLVFLKAYLGCTRLTPFGKWLWRWLARRAN